jgi:threonine dehydrogenase-like Zn-dependent dehydrogenase
MLAVTLRAGSAGSAELTNVDEPDPSAGAMLCETIAVGVDGTDVQIVDGFFGEAPPGRERLVLGHESLGRVLDVPPGFGVSVGDLVVAFVRLPDPVPCEACAADEWDMCRNGLYTEHGIKGVDGFLSERFRVEPERVVRADPALGRLAVLTEPTSIVAKAWEQAERIGGRTAWTPRRALVTGAGPLGLLAAMLGTQRGLETHVLDVVETGPKPDRARELGVGYWAGSLNGLDDDLDVVIECTGAGSLAFHAMEHLAPDGVMVMTGISAARRSAEIAVDALGTRIVMNNNAIVGSVNANRRHYEEAVRALSRADPKWLDRLVTRWVPLDRWSDALKRREDDVKIVVEVAA